jgi:prolyl-tRNA synthetase
VRLKPSRISNSIGKYVRLVASGIRAYVDDRDNYNPGWKYNHWEQKGVPLRFELGPKDIDKNEVRVVQRFDGKKYQLS